ncbi:MAG TPA: hypothetical protein VFM54_16655 [Micromonosporaceae bacterium]|nr:hypothetical protein [Micromonosporaceae bacterium]
MRIAIRLAEADRARLGCPDGLVFDRAAVTMRDLRTIQRETGILYGRFMTAVVDNDGDALHAMVWVALKQAGVDVAFNELDFLAYEASYEVVPEPGKDPSPATTSAGSSPSTP